MTHFSVSLCLYVCVCVWWFAVLGDKSKGRLSVFFLIYFVGHLSMNSHFCASLCFYLNDFDRP